MENNSKSETDRYTINNVKNESDIPNIERIERNKIVCRFKS